MEQSTAPEGKAGAGLQPTVRSRCLTRAPLRVGRWLTQKASCATAPSWAAALHGADSGLGDSVREVRGHILIGDTKVSLLVRSIQDVKKGKF